MKRKALTLSQSRRRDGRDTRLVLRKSIVCALTLALSSFEPAGAAAPLAGLLPDAAGTRVHLRAVRTVQAASGPISTVTVFDLVRRAPATLVLERTRADGTPNPSVLTVTKDGALALAEDTHGAAADADANDLLEGLNLALAATREADGSTHSWAATLATSPDAGAPTASMILIPVGIAGNEFDFKGDAQAAAAPERSRSEAGGSGMGAPGGGAGGFRRGGGSRGGGSGRGGAAMTVALHIEGHIASGRITRVAVAEIRSITLANMPFTNTGSWAFTISH